MKIINCIIFVVFTIATAQDLETNNKCSYTMGKKLFTCMDLTNVDKNIEKFITDDTHMLVLKNTKEAHFGSNYFKGKNYLNIVTLNILLGNKLEIKQSAFSGLKNLNYLKINGNHLYPRIEDGSFLGLDSLELLNLDNNDIKSIDSGAFRGLKKLVTLSISENSLNVLYPNTFSDLINLNTLLLGFNNISTIEHDAFSDLPNLQTLDLSHNSLKVLNLKEFNVMAGLNTLYLGYNQISSVEDVFRLKNLKFLEMQRNQLKNISKDLFINAQALKSLDLSYQYFVEIDETPFLNLSSLTHINLRNTNANIKRFQTLSKTVSVVF